MLEIFDSSVKAFYFAMVNLLFLGVLFFLLALLVKGRKVFHAMRASLSGSIFNVVLMSLNIVVITPVIAMMAGYMSSYDYALLETDIWEAFPQLFVVVCAVFAGDFVGYWRHRLEHSRLLWPSHIVHHSDTQMTWLTLQRFHPINRLSTYLIDSAFLIALGLPAYAIVVNNLVRHYYGHFIHADLPWTYGKLGLIFVSPAMHRWHHAEECEAHNTNFATVFSLFDRMFGTYRVPGICDVPLGVSYIGNSGLSKQLLYPFKLSSYMKASYSSRSNSEILAD